MKYLFLIIAISAPAVWANLDIKFPDPLKIKDFSTTYDTNKLKGNFSLRNGQIVGLSTLEINPRLHFASDSIIVGLNVSLDRLVFTGEYEVVDGEFYVDNKMQQDPHEYLFSGKGAVNVSLTDFDAQFGFKITIDSNEKFESIEDFKADVKFESAYVKLENFLLNSQLVDWEVINVILKPTFDSAWEDLVPDFQDRVFNHPKFNAAMKESSIRERLGEMIRSYL